MSRWPTVPLSEVCDIRIGRTPRRDTPAYWNGPHPWATVGELNGGEIVETDEGITDFAVSTVMPPPVPKGTLLFSFKLSIGKMAIAGRSLHHNEAIAALPIKRPDVLMSDFLPFALRSATHDGAANHAVLGKVLNKAKVEAISLPLPPLDEQQRIVDILNHAASIRRLREQAKAKAKELIPALFLDMLGDPATNPNGWDTDLVKNILSVKGGKRLPKGARYAEQPTPYRYLRGTDIHPGWIEQKRMLFLPEEIQRGIRRYTVRAGDVVITIAGTIGIAAPISEDLSGVNLTENAAKLCSRNPDTLNATYLSWILNSRFVQEQIKTLIGRVTIGKLALERVELIKLVLPPLPLQQTFAERVADIQATIDQMDRAAAAAEQLQAALMARLFDGG
jgi:type I restriction enzyme S subunit